MYKNTISSIRNLRRYIYNSLSFYSNPSNSIFIYSNKIVLEPFNIDLSKYIYIK